MKFIGAILSCAILAGCGGLPGQPAFDHSTASYDQMMRDRLECLQGAGGFIAAGERAAAMPNRDLYNNCMAVRGYTRNDESGRLRVPYSLRVRTY